MPLFLTSFPILEFLLSQPTDESDNIQKDANNMCVECDDNQKDANNMFVERAQSITDLLTCMAGSDANTVVIPAPPWGRGGAKRGREKEIGRREETAERIGE
jgi:hypothetical protein